MIRRHFFGCYKDGRFHLSRVPPDGPVRPSTTYETVHEINALLSRKGLTIDWWPPLPEDIRAQVLDQHRQDGLRMEGR